MAGHKEAVAFLRSQEVPELWKMDMSQILDSSSSDEDEDAAGREKDSEEEEETKKKRSIKEEVRLAREDSFCYTGYGFKTIDVSILKLTAAVFRCARSRGHEADYASSLSSEGM